jgi:hypothetical protein
MNTVLSNRHNVLGKLGDFWYRQLSDKDNHGVALAKAMTHLTDASSAIDDLGTVAEQLTGRTTNLRSNYTIKFNINNIKVINLNFDPAFKPGQYTLDYTGYLKVSNLAAGSDTATADYPEVLADDDTGGIKFPLQDRTITLSANEARPLYYVPIPFNVTPVCVTTSQRELTVGTSFLTNPGYILFFENPLNLFPDYQIVCRSAYIRQSHIMDYTYQADNVFNTGEYIARYMRLTHSPVALRLALAEVANLPILKQDSVLQATYTNFEATIYEFDTEVLRVPLYVEHTPLVVGTTYGAHTIIGEDYIKVFSQANTATVPWYRDAELSAVWSADGLDLSPLTPFQAVKVLDTVGTFSYNGATGTAPLHYKLSGLTGADTGAYWNFVRQSEIHTGTSLSYVSGVTAGATANGIDFYFDNMLQYNAVVIKLRTKELGHAIHANVMAFIQRDLPINVTPIILS